MSSTFKAACIQTNTTNDLDHNIKEVEQLVREAADKGAQFITMPENVFYMRAKDSDDVPLFTMEMHPGVQMCIALASELNVWLLIGSVFVPSSQDPTDGARWYNRQLLINNSGTIVSHYDKIHLFDASFGENKSYQESARIKHGEQVATAHLPWAYLGMTICYDVRFPHLYRDLAKHGVDVLAIPAAFAYVTGVAHWHVLLRARAIENAAYVIAAAQCGTHPGDKKTYGHAMIISPWGEIIAEAPEDETGVIVADIDMDYVKKIRSNMPTLTHDRAYLPPPDYNI